MKNKFILGAGIVLGLNLLYFGCKKDDSTPVPAASTQSNFSIDSISNRGYYPCTVYFKNTSVNSLGYLWNFGNGETSTAENPSSFYDTAGIFPVSLTCTALNNVYYNNLVKSYNLAIKDPNAGAKWVIYFADRAAGMVKFAVIDNNAPVIQEVAMDPLSRIYGMDVDTTHKKLYFSDSNGDGIYMANTDGTGFQQIVATDPGPSGPFAVEVVNDKVFWSMEFGIYSANLDGTNPQKTIDLSTGAPEMPLDMDFDVANQVLYFVNDKEYNSGGIWKINIDGSNPQQIIAGIDGTAFEVDYTHGKMYYANYGDAIYMANLDGSGIVSISACGSSATWGIGHSAEMNSLFWGIRNSTGSPDGKIVKSALDGSNPVDWITGINPYAFSVTKVKL